MHIVFNLVSQMGGTIAVENHVGDGVTFLIEMPLMFPNQSSDIASSSAGMAGVTESPAQGSTVNTGNELDMAIEGEGFFVLSNGSQNIYSRGGAFALDFNSNLVDFAGSYLARELS